MLSAKAPVGKSTLNNNNNNDRKRNTYVDKDIASVKTAKHL